MLNGFKIIEFVKSINITFFIAFILIIYYASFSLSGNEEQYMLFAKQFMEPDWITSRFLNEFPGTRYLYQVIIGFFLKFFSFESVLFVSRILLCILYAIPLAKIYKELNLNNFHVLIHLPILFLANQSFFAGSWMFVSVEPKGLAYIFILFALLFFLRKNIKWMTFYLIVATYCHILIGGYTFIFFFTTLFLYEPKSSIFKNVKLLAFYIIATVPLLLYLKTAINIKVDYNPSVSWIYTYFRHPHHLALFKSPGYFYSKHFYGILSSVIALLLSISFSGQLKNEKLKHLNNFVIVSLIGLLLFVVIAFFDNEGIFLKYYPFRINTLTTFVLFLILTSLLISIIKNESIVILKQIVFYISIVILFKAFLTSIIENRNYLNNETNSELINITNYIKSNTPKNSVVLSFLEDLSLNRRMERDRFVVYKFIPADMNAIPEWYERELYKRKLSKDFNTIKKMPESYKIDYVLTRQQMDSNCVQLIENNKLFYLYKVNLD